MNGTQQLYPAVSTLLQGSAIIGSCHLIAAEHLGVHAPEEDHKPLGFGTALQHIGPRPHVELGFALPKGRHLPPLVRQSDPEGIPPFPIGQEPYKVPEEGGLSASRWGQEQGVLKLPPTEQGGQHLRPTAGNGVGHPDI